MIVLDTMAVLYFLGGSESFRQHLRQELDASPRVCISVASFWEIGIKGRAGKLDLDGKPIDTPSALRELIEECQRAGFELIPINEQHVCAASYLPGTHKDPFDRMIVAQALERDATLFSSDASLDALSPDLRRKWASPTRRS